MKVTRDMVDQDLRGAYAVAFILNMAITQGWRSISETLRADYRGGGQFSAYQAMGVLAIVFSVGLNYLADSELGTKPDLGAGVPGVSRQAHRHLQPQHVLAAAARVALDALVTVLADEVRLDLFNRLARQGIAEVGYYFHRYEQGNDWHLRITDG
jgi:hypothetical protein